MLTGGHQILGKGRGFWLGRLCWWSRGQNGQNGEAIAASLIGESGKSTLRFLDRRADGDVVTRRPSFRFHRRQAAHAHGRGRGGERGVSVIEAAFVTPVFFILILGVFELGLVMNDQLAVANTVRAGARTASATGNDPYGDFQTLRKISRESAALDRSSIEHIVIYKATGFGDGPSATCRSGTPVTGVCNVYDAADFSRDRDEFACSRVGSPSRHWCPGSRKITLVNGGTEFVGVWMAYSHAWVTKMFGDTVELTDSSVIRLEPRTRT